MSDILPARINPFQKRAERAQVIVSNNYSNLERVLPREVSYCGVHCSCLEVAVDPAEALGARCGIPQRVACAREEFRSASDKSDMQVLVVMGMDRRSPCLLRHSLQER